MSKLYWSSTQENDYWMNEASDEEVLEEFLETHNKSDIEEIWDPYVFRDENDNITEVDYDAMRDDICQRNFDLYNEQAVDDFVENIFNPMLSQLTEGILIIDGDFIPPEKGYRRYGRSMSKNDCLYYPTIEKLEDPYTGASEVYVDEDNNIEGWFTLPKTRAGLYKLARAIPEIQEDVKDELEARDKYSEDYEDEMPTGVDLWLDMLDARVVRDELSDIDWYGVEDYLIPIHVR